MLFLASEYSKLTREERLRGMEAIAKAAKGKKPALVLGVQGPNKAAALAYLEKAESVAPDAIIAIPPTEAKSLDDFREYYRALARELLGITAAQGAASRLGVSLTHRATARRLQYITGHGSDGKLPKDIDWKSVADPVATTIVYMPRKTLRRTGRHLTTTSSYCASSLVKAFRVKRPTCSNNFE